MKYDTLLFDADGTLLDFELAEHDAFISAMAQFGINADEGTISVYSKLNDALWKKLERKEIEREVLKVRRFEELASALAVDYDATKVARTYENELSNQPHLLGNALEVCAELSSKCRLYIITNGFKMIQEGRIHRSPIYPLFSNVFISEEVGYDKPALQYFEAVKNAIPNFCAEKTLVIGDSLTSDIRGGIDAGIPVCWFNPKHKHAPVDMNIDYVIDDLACLVDIIK
jgi:2-haloacid dehalogenase